MLEEYGRSVRGAPPRCVGGVPVHDRRAFLKKALLTGLALALPLGGLWRGLRVERRGRMFLIDGWVLTAEDVRALRDHVL
jgi:hypothetical protein